MSKLAQPFKPSGSQLFYDTVGSTDKTLKLYAERIMRRWLIWVIAIVPTLSFVAASPPFEFLGKFSNMTYSQEHQDGEVVYLWREKTELY